MPSIVFDSRFLLVAATNFCLFLIVSSLSFLPVIIVEMGGDNIDVGLVMGSIGVTSLGALPFLAPLIDRYGRKIFIVGGILLMGLTNAGFLLFSEYSHLMIGVRLIQGLAFAACFNGCATAIVDLVPPDKRAQGIGLFGVSGSISVSLGPYVCESFLVNWGHSAYFCVLIAFGLIGFVAGLMVTEPALQPGQGKSNRGFFPTAAHDGHLTMMMMAVVFGSAFASIMTFFPLHATNLGLRGGVFFVSYGLSLIVIRVVLGHLVDSFSRDKLIFWCLLGFGFLLALTSQVDSVVQTVFLGALFGIVQGVSYPAMMARMVDRSTQQNRAVVVALFTGSFGVGINVSVLGWGLIANEKGLPFMFLAGGIIMFAVAAVYVYAVTTHSAWTVRR
jgi:MFS family permease